VTETPVSLLATLRAGVEAAFAFAQQKRATSTRHGYEAHFRLFEAWCGDNELAGRPEEPASVAIYITIEAQRGIRPSTLERRLAAIRHTHIEAGHESPADNRHVHAILRYARPKPLPTRPPLIPRAKPPTRGGGLY
jgi:site-specific recombinase XerD